MKSEECVTVYQLVDFEDEKSQEYIWNIPPSWTQETFTQPIIHILGYEQPEINIKQEKIVKEAKKTLEIDDKVYSLDVDLTKLQESYFNPNTRYFNKQVGKRFAINSLGVLTIGCLLTIELSSIALIFPMLALYDSMKENSRKQKQIIRKVAPLKKELSKHQILVGNLEKALIKVYSISDAQKVMANYKEDREYKPYQFFDVDALNQKLEAIYEANLPSLLEAVS